MEENSSISFWKIAVTILLAAILIGVVLLISRQGKSVTNEKLESISNALAEYQDEEYAIYGGMEVSGAEVRSLIERACAKGDYVSVRVKTKAGSVVSYNYTCADSGENPTMALTKETGANPTKMHSDAEGALPTAADYINPSAVFSGSIARDANGILVLVSFEQK